jgi:hypothetical protein
MAYCSDQELDVKLTVINSSLVRQQEAFDDMGVDGYIFSIAWPRLIPGKAIPHMLKYLSCKY